MSSKKDYEHYLEQDESNWSEYFNNLNKYWKCMTADICDDMKEYLYDYEGTTEKLADMTDDPEAMDLLVASGKMRTIALLSEKTLKAIGRCIDATATLFNKDDTYSDTNTTIRIGDHLCVKKGTKEYHAIYIGGKNAIMYTKDIDSTPQVKKIPIAVFTQFGKAKIISDEFDVIAIHSPEAIVKRALSRLGENSFRNSESFVQWCRCGE